MVAAVRNRGRVLGTSGVLAILMLFAIGAVSPCLAGICTLWGRAVDSIDGAGVAGAAVKIEAAAFTSNALSLADGFFVLDVLPGDGYPVEITRAGYLPAQVTAPACPADSFSDMGSVEMVPEAITAERYGFVVQDASPREAAVSAGGQAATMAFSGVHLDIIDQVSVRTPRRFITSRIVPGSRRPDSIAIEVSANDQAEAGTAYQVVFWSSDPPDNETLPLSLARIIVTTPVELGPVKEAEALASTPLPGDAQQRRLTVQAGVAGVEPETLTLVAGGGSRRVTITGENLNYYDTVREQNFSVTGAVNRDVAEIDSAVVATETGRLTVLLNARAGAVPHDMYELYISSSGEAVDAVPFSPRWRFAVTAPLSPEKALSPDLATRAPDSGLTIRSPGAQRRVGDLPTRMPPSAMPRPAPSPLHGGGAAPSTPAPRRSAIELSGRPAPRVPTAPRAPAPAPAPPVRATVTGFAPASVRLAPGASQTLVVSGAGLEGVGFRVLRSGTPVRDVTARVQSAAASRAVISLTADTGALAAGYQLQVLAGSRVIGSLNLTVDAPVPASDAPAVPARPRRLLVR